jgi:hypothetical protein
VTVDGKLIFVREGGNMWEGIQLALQLLRAVGLLQERDYSSFEYLNP